MLPNKKLLQRVFAIGRTEKHEDNARRSHAIGKRLCLVPFRGEWSLNGVPDALRCEQTPDGDFRIPVRINEGMGVDAIWEKPNASFWPRVIPPEAGSAWATASTGRRRRRVGSGIARGRRSDRVNALRGIAAWIV